MRYSLYAVMSFLIVSVAQAQVPCFNNIQTFYGPPCAAETVEVSEEPEAPAALPPQPLFTKESVAPSTPPPMLDLLNAPGRANAERAYAWNELRFQHMWAAEKWIQQIHREQKGLQ